MKTGYLHPKRQILPFDIRRTDFAVVRDANNLSDLRSRYTRRSIATRARALRRIVFSDDRIGGAVAEKRRIAGLYGPHASVLTWVLPAIRWLKSPMKAWVLIASRFPT